MLLNNDKLVDKSALKSIGIFKDIRNWGLRIKKFRKDNPQRFGILAKV